MSKPNNHHTPTQFRALAKLLEALGNGATHRLLCFKLRPYIERRGYTTGDIFTDAWVILDSLYVPPSTPSTAKFKF
jgi:hypothetical protein